MFWKLVSILIFTETLLAGKVIFLHGTTCAGKTSICRELKKTYDWKVVEADELFCSRLVLSCKTEFPKEFSVIEDAVEE